MLHYVVRTGLCNRTRILRVGAWSPEWDAPPEERRAHPTVLRQIKYRQGSRAFLTDWLHSPLQQLRPTEGDQRNFFLANCGGSDRVAKMEPTESPLQTRRASIRTASAAIGRIPDRGSAAGSVFVSSSSINQTWPEMVANVLLMLLPNVLTAPTHTAAISAAISPYSSIVTARRSVFSSNQVFRNSIMERLLFRCSAMTRGGSTGHNPIGLPNTCRAQKPRTMLRGSFTLGPRLKSAGICSLALSSLIEFPHLWKELFLMGRPRSDDRIARILRIGAWSPEWDAPPEERRAHPTALRQIKHRQGSRAFLTDWLHSPLRQPRPTEGAQRNRHHVTDKAFQRYHLTSCDDRSKPPRAAR